MCYFFCFFFQAEDGIRDGRVTGVQTCALPIFIILDEGQNTTVEQMKMFLTRIGFNSKAIITGDATQIDLVNRRDSGLLHAVEVLKEVKGISVTQFQPSDVVRHPLVQCIVEAYEKHNNK